MAEKKIELNRDMSLFDITMIGVGAMIGAGIFVLTGIAAGEAGPALILAFALNGVITLFTAMVYAELGSAIPEAGGGYLWVKEGLPGPNAFLSGWMSWFAHAVAGSLYALGFGGYMGLVFSEVGIFQSIDPTLLGKGFAVLIIALFMAINFKGASETSTIGNVVTILKIIVLLIFIVSGLLTILDHPVYMKKFSENFAPNELAGVLGAMGLTFIAFEGYEIIAQAGEEVVNPRRNVPKAIFLSLAIVIPIYILVAFVSLGAPETPILFGETTPQPTYLWLAEHEETGIAEAARQFMPLGTFLILIGGLLSTMSALNATTYSSTRVSFAMGRDKGLPDAFAEVHEETHTPHKALLFTGVLITFMALAIPIKHVAAAADIMFLLLFLQVNFAVITIRKKFGANLSYGFLTPFFPAVPIIGIIAEFFLAMFLFTLSSIAWVFVAGWISIGLVIFYGYSRPRQKEQTRTPLARGTKITPVTELPRYRVLVAVANINTLPSLIPTAVAAAKRNDGMVMLLNVIPVPGLTPISRGREFVEDENRALITKAKEMIGDAVLVDEMFRLSHRPSQAIVDTAKEINANLVIMGWSGKGSESESSIGRNIEQIYNTINCEVLTIQTDRLPKDPDYTSAKKILVPIADVAQLPLSLRAIGNLTPADAVTEIDILHVFAEDLSQAACDTTMKKLTDSLAATTVKYPWLDGKVTIKTVTQYSKVEAIVAVSEEYDYIVLGTTRDGWLKRRFFGSKPTRITEASNAPVVLVRPKTGLAQFGLHQMLNYFRGGYSEATPESKSRLSEHGLLDPNAALTPDELKSTVSQIALLIIGAFTLGALWMIYIGSGETLTWIGTGIFLLMLWIFTWVSIRAPEPPLPRPENVKKVE